MPLMDVTFSQGSLNTDAQSRLSTKLWSIALRWEGIEINETSASVAWVYLDERPQHHVTVAGKSPTQNIYRINVRVMAGFMDQKRIDSLARELTDSILEVDGTKGDGSGPREPGVQLRADIPVQPAGEAFQLADERNRPLHQSGFGQRVQAAGEHIGPLLRVFGAGEQLKRLVEQGDGGIRGSLSQGTPAGLREKPSGPCAIAGLQVERGRGLAPFAR